MQYFASYYRWLVASQTLGVQLGGTRVLDVGCDDAQFLGRSTAPLRVGVDLAPRARPADGIEIVRADARILPVLSGSFDTILAFDVLEHIDNDRAVMSEMLRILAPGGRIWFSTPAIKSAIFPAFLQPYANRSFGHVRNGYTLEAMRDLLPADGYRLDAWYWSEPALRAGFVPMHALWLVAPALSHAAMRLAHRLDGRARPGLRGHIFGTITRER